MTAKNNNPLQDRLREQIEDYLKTLKLNRIRARFDEELLAAAKGNLSTLQLIHRLLEIEVNSLTVRRIERRIKDSSLPEKKLLGDFDFEFQKSLDKAQVMHLAGLSFVEQQQGLILAGSSGTGKSHIAKALLLLGCQKLYRCKYTTASVMLKNLMAGLADGSLEKKMRVYINPQILLIDEVGFDRLEQESVRNASLFFKVIDARYCRASTILTTNIDFKDLGDYLGDPVITTAIVDRMVHHSTIINIQGPSWRMYESKKLNVSSRKNASKGKKK
jgi:DNA replication protein DnaC